MTTPTRYDLTADGSAEQEMVPYAEGDYVLFTDYASLAAEHKRLLDALGVNSAEEGLRMVETLKTLAKSGYNYP